LAVNRDEKRFAEDDVKIVGLEGDGLDRREHEATHARRAHINAGGCVSCMIID